MAREEGKGGVSNFEKRHNTDLFLFLVFKYISHLYYVLFYVFFIFSNGKRQKKLFILLGYLGSIKPESNLKPNRINYSQNHPNLK